MGEYGRKQRNQLRKTISHSESKSSQLKGFVDNRPQAVGQTKLIYSIQKKPNNTGLPDNLKAGIENLSDYSMDDVKVHYNSDKPAQPQALAYAQGADIHVAPRQEKHLPHEAWHVVQQKQERVQPTTQLQVMGVNDNYGMVKKAEVIGGETKCETDCDLNMIQQKTDKSISQFKPSTFKLFYDSNSLYNLPIHKQIESVAWNAFVIYTKPYAIIDDKDIEQRKLWINGWYRHIRSIFDNAKDLTEEHKITAAKVMEMFEREKIIIFANEKGYELPEKEKILLFPEPITKDDTDEYSGALFENLWVKNPTIDDIKQGGLGDCYLLAAVASVVHREPNHFKTHIIDNENGTVCVTLYETEGKPVNINVIKSVVDNKYARETLWVKLLEKAYAAAGFDKNADKSYKGIEGGNGGDALMHLTGKYTKGFAIGRNRKTIIEKIKKELSTFIESIQTKKEEKDSDFQIKLKINIDEVLLEIDSLLITKYITKSQLDQLISKIPDIIVGKSCLKNMISKIVDDGDLPLLPGELGSNEYGKDEIELFKFIKDHIDNGDMLTMSTKIKIDDADNVKEIEKGHSAGEDLVKGLASKHAYSILEYANKDGKIEIQLRNPWGKYSRVYDIGVGKVSRKEEKEGNGIFWMDIADIVASFDSVSTTTGTTHLIV